MDRETADHLDGRRSAARLWSAETAFEFRQELDLAGIDPLNRCRDVEKRRAINFGKLLHLPRARWPLELEGVALQGCGTAIAFKCPRFDALASLLGDFANLDVRALGPEAEFFRKFSLRRFERGLAGRDLPFWDTPCAQVLLGPKRPAGVDEEHLGFVAPNAVHDEAGADFGHAWRVAKGVGIRSMNWAVSAALFHQHRGLFVGRRS